MKIKEDFESDIEYLVKACNKDTIFLSDWNNINPQLEFPTNIVKQALSKYEHKNLYTFSEEIEDIKQKYADKYSDNTYKVSFDEYTVVSNGTIGGFLLLNSVRKLLNNKVRAMMIAPVYFTYINILKEFGAEIYYMQGDLEQEMVINLVAFEEEIKSNSINLVVITNPLFSTGISVGDDVLREMAILCRKYNAYLLIDNVYGGTMWNQEPQVVDYAKIALSNEFKNVLVLESISKRVFLNGIKTALVFAEKNIILDVETCATYYAGSIAYPQMEIFCQLYQGKNDAAIKEVIKRVVSYCKSSYCFVNQLIKDTDLVTLRCNEGFFCLVGIPYHNISVHRSKISDDIMFKHNILVISHDRYLFESEDYFYFRLNLTLPKEKLQEGISTLVSLYGRNRISSILMY